MKLSSPLPLLSLTLALSLAGAAQAQNTTAPKAPAAPAATAASASAPSSPAKKALVAKILQLQQPGIEAMARQLVEQPALQMMQQVPAALQRVPADKREALAKDIQADARKYAEDATPFVRERAIKLAPTTIGPVLEDRFSEAELRQIVALLESPVNRKFQSLAGEMQRALGQQLVADVRPTIEPKVKTLEQTIVKRLGAASAASAPKP